MIFSSLYYRKILIIIIVVSNDCNFLFYNSISIVILFHNSTEAANYNAFCVISNSK